MSERDSIIDGLMQCIEYTLSSCEENGRLSESQKTDFDAACYRLRHFGADAEQYVLESISYLNRCME